MIGVLARRGLRAMCVYNVWSIRAGQLGADCIGHAMRFIPARENGDGHAATTRSTVPLQAMEEWRGGEA